MRAAVYHGPRDVRIETRPRPRPSPQQLLVEVAVAAICGTDAAEYHDGPHLIPAGGEAIVLGHEFTGRVVEVGAAVEGFARGDRVVSGAGVWCGECDWCRSDPTDLSLREVELRGTVAHVCGRNLPAALDLLTRTDLAQRVAGPTIALEQFVEQGLAPLAEHRARGKILIDLSR